MKELFEIANEYYARVGLIAAMKREKIVLAFYLVAIVCLITSITLIIFDNPLSPIGWRDFLSSFKGLFYLLSLCSTLLFYFLIDRAKLKDLETKKKLLCDVLNCKEQELRDYLDAYEAAYDKYKKYNEDSKDNPLDPFIKISKFASWIITTILAVVIKEEMTKPNNPNLMKLIILVLLLYSVVAIFWSFVPAWFRGLQRLLKNTEARITFLFSELSYIAPVKSKKGRKM